MHSFIDSTASPSPLLSTPPDLLDRIVNLVVLKPDVISVFQTRSKDAGGRWHLNTDSRGFLNLTRTCRQLYETSIEQAYAKNDFQFKTLATDPYPTTFMAFYQQVGPTNARHMTSVLFHGMPPDREFDILFIFSALQELRIDIPTWIDYGEAENAFGDRLRVLQPSDVPSLQHLSIDIEKEGSHKHRRRRPFTSWVEIESAVNVARATLFLEGARAEIDLSEADL